jgi:SPX domain protein involved in polyphosphate accumulation
MVRSELKFVFEEDMFNYLLNSINNHPAFFREIYHERQINNIYFDTDALSNYYANINGHGSREKYRIRWYDDLLGYVENPHLEVKRKFGLVGDKQSIRLPDLVVNDNFSWFDYIDKFNSDTKSNKIENYYINMLKGLKPAIANAYKRRYFISANNNFRLTVDFDINYHKVSTNYLDPQSIKEHNLIIELKYDPIFSEEAPSITNYYNWRVTRNSKYINGVNLLYFHLAPNSFIRCDS